MQDSEGASKVRINLGCGSKHMDGYTNVDIRQPCDIEWDLEITPLPFKDKSIDIVLADNIFEHLHNFVPLMTDIHRILKDDGKLDIIVPIYPFTEVFQDPTHVRYFTEKTFNYYLEGNFNYENIGKGYGFMPYKTINKRREGFLLYVGYGK